MSREWVTNVSYGIKAREGYNRCACGNPNLMISCHTYKDGTKGYIVSCFECGRRLDIDGTEDDLKREWNKYNADAGKISFRISNVPDTITIYAKPEDNINELAKKALFSKIRIERIVPKK